MYGGNLPIFDDTDSARVQEENINEVPCEVNHRHQTQRDTERARCFQQYSSSTSNRMNHGEKIADDFQHLQIQKGSDGSRNPQRYSVPKFYQVGCGENVADGIQHLQQQRDFGSNGGAQQFPIYDAISMKSFSKPGTPSSQVQRGPIKPTVPYHGRQLNHTSYPPSLLDMDTQRNSRSSNVSRYKDDVQKKKRNRHSSAQRTSQSQIRERFRSVERPGNVNNNGKSITAENRSHQDYYLQQRDDQCQLYRPYFLTGNDPVKNEIGMPTCDDIFNFMVKTMDGKGTPKSIRKRSKLFPTTVNVSDWFRKNKSSFTIIEKNGNISCIFVFNNKATYCIRYGKNSCSSTDCPRYHICRNLCSGKCIHGRRCKYSHDCFDEHNKRISDDLGFSKTFSNDEICIILRLSFPHVCTTWSLKGLCENLKCVDLHLCPGYIIGKCGLGETCEKSHDKNTAHNRAILDAFEMTEMKHEVFRWRVFVVHSVPWTRNDTTVPVATASKGPRMSNLVNEEADDSGEMFICVDHILGECRERHCKYIHNKSRLPYVWQINLFDEWISLKESEEIEEKFADNADCSATFQTTYNGLDLYISVNFESGINACVKLGASTEEIRARRLSTMSYISYASSSLYGSKNKNSDKFFTQWRWYWPDDIQQWNLYRPDAFQYTLEAKYLANQHTYLFPRENFYYTISFDKMHQLNTTTKAVRRIRRRPIFVSSQDLAKKECPLSLDDVTLINTPRPESWVPWDLCRPFELVEITRDQSTEVDQVTNLFFKTIDRVTKNVRAIYRVQNHKLWGFFCNEETSLQDKARRNGYTSTGINKQLLFHGTDDEHAANGICVNNFDIRVSGKSGTMYGDGAYFARDAKYSDCYTKGPVRYMFVVNVLVGQYAKADPSYRRPPELPGSRELYDSCVDDISDPKIFVVFDRNQYYPQYLIKYRDRV